MSDVFCDKCKHYYSISGYYDHEPHCAPMTTDNIRAEFEKWFNATGWHSQPQYEWLLYYEEYLYLAWQTATASMQAENQRLREALEAVLDKVAFPIGSELMKQCQEALNDTKQTTEGE